eukprot:scaffold554_cov112-Isochrysis_galbana.AAC.2
MAIAMWGRPPSTDARGDSIASTPHDAWAGPKCRQCTPCTASSTVHHHVPGGSIASTPHDVRAGPKCRRDTPCTASSTVRHHVRRGSMASTPPPPRSTPHAARIGPICSASSTLRHHARGGSIASTLRGDRAPGTCPHCMLGIVSTSSVQRCSCPQCALPL